MPSDELLWGEVCQFWGVLDPLGRLARTALVTAVPDLRARIAEAGATLVE